MFRRSIRSLGYILPAGLSLWVAYLAFTHGRVIGRAGATGLTRESNPFLFWFELIVLSLVGLLLGAYGITLLLNRGAAFRANVDSLAKRIGSRLPWWLFRR